MSPTTVHPAKCSRCGRDCQVSTGSTEPPPEPFTCFLCWTSDHPEVSGENKPIGGKDLRDLLIGNSQFRVMWIGGVRYEMPKDEDPPVSEARPRRKETP